MEGTGRIACGLLLLGLASCADAAPPCTDCEIAKPVGPNEPGEPVAVIDAPPCSDCEDTEPAVVVSAGGGLRTIALDRMKEIAGPAATKVAIVDGVLDVSRFGEADLVGNEGAALLRDLASSAFWYAYAESSTIETAAGPRPVSKLENLDNRPDWRINTKTPGFLPPPGVDDTIAFTPVGGYVDAATQTQPVSRAAVAFHELAEAYAKIDKGLPYVYRDGSPGAHHDAVVREATLLTQRPDFTVYPAGGTLMYEP